MAHQSVGLLTRHMLAIKKEEEKGEKQGREAKWGGIELTPTATEPPAMLWDTQKGTDSVAVKQTGQSCQKDPSLSAALSSVPP